MSLYSKTNLDRIAKENGFIRDNLEKVIRLSDILRYFNNSSLLIENLALKGGTAINLTVFNQPRLSVDIDLDFTKECSKKKRALIEQKNTLLLYRKQEKKLYLIHKVCRDDKID